MKRRVKWTNIIFTLISWRFDGVDKEKEKKMKLFEL